MALGVARRAVSMLPESAVADSLASEIDRCREVLVAEPVEGRPRPAARRPSSPTARPAHSVVAGGGPSLLVTEQAQRLAREALFLLVFGQTGDIRGAELAELGRLGPPGHR